MSEPGLETTVRAGVRTLRFARPESLNALTPEMLDTATVAVTQAAHDPAVRVVVFTGAGRAFSSGADLAGRDDFDAGRGGTTLDAANALVAAIATVPKPVVATVHGPAAGVGATIALACDLVIAKTSAYFLLAFANIGLMPDGGATAIVPASIGRARAARMALLGEKITAPTALEWGLVSHVVADDEFDAEVDAVVTKLAAGPTRAYAHTKAALRAATLAMLEQAHAIERAGQHELFRTADFDEGVRAFLGRRPPAFEGK